MSVIINTDHGVEVTVETKKGQQVKAATVNGSVIVAETINGHKVDIITESMEVVAESRQGNKVSVITSAPVVEVIIKDGIPIPFPADGGTEEKIDMFIPADGQTIFTLSEEPGSLSNVEMRVNGLKVNSFTRNGVTITYTGTNYVLSTSDLVEFTYT